MQGAFDDLGVQWYLFGAQAAFLYGASRLTVDVDVTVALERRAPHELVSALERHGIKSRVEDPEFVERTRVLPVTHVPTRTAGDIVLAGPGLEEAFLARAEPREILGVAVPVASAEDIVVMKILAGRPKDLEDVKAIVAAQGDALGSAEIRSMLGVVEEALGQSDLLPLFESTAKAARPSRRSRMR
ncbi:MAG: DUF6036 family nucleotidyltransferase [Polyangiaceae bacterium]